MEYHLAATTVQSEPRSMLFAPSTPVCCDTGTLDAGQKCRAVWTPAACAHRLAMPGGLRLLLPFGRLEKSKARIQLYQMMLTSLIPCVRRASRVPPKAGLVCTCRMPSAAGGPQCWTLRVPERM